MMYEAYGSSGWLSGKMWKEGVLITKSYCLDTFSEDWEMIQDTNRLSIFYPPKASCCDNQSAIFALLCIHTSMFCIFSKLWATWENTWMLIWGSGDVLCGIPSCTLFRGVQLKSYFKHPVTTLCGSVCTCTPLYVELFICLLHFPAHFIWRNTRGQEKGRKKRLLSKLGFGWGRER